MKQLLVAIISILFLFSCSKSDEIQILPTSINPVNASEVLDPAIVNNIPLSESIVKGLLVYGSSKDSKGNSCMNCHISKDGFDIALFNDKDSIPFMNRVFHQALKHVSTEDAKNVMNYIKSLTKNIVLPRNSIKNVFQPGLDVVSESKFATSIGLNDSEYSLAQINSWNFKEIKVPITLPSWIDTQSNMDWMPDNPLELLKLENVAVQNAYNLYLENPNDESFVRFKRVVWSSLTDGQKHPGEFGYSNFEQSFNTMRWLSSAYIQHVIRYRNGNYGIFNIIVDGRASDDIYESVLDPIWAVGDIARRSLDNGSVSVQITNRKENMAMWLYLGWIGNYGITELFETEYICKALYEDEFKIMVIPVALKSIVNRPNNSQSVYDDIKSLTLYIDANSGYFDKTTNFALTFVLNKLNTNKNNMAITGQSIVWATNHLNEARGYINQKASNSNKAQLLIKIDKIIAEIKSM